MIVMPAPLSAAPSGAKALRVWRHKLELRTHLLAGEPAAVQRLLRRLRRRDLVEPDVHETLQRLGFRV